MAATNMFDATKVGVAKGRPGGYAAVFPADYDVSKLTDVKKTLKELITDSAGKGAALGYISEDGVEFGVSLSSDDKSDWGGDTVSSAISKYGETAKMTFLQSAETVLKVIYGDANVSTKSGVVEVRHNANLTQPRIYVFDAVISETTVKRSVIPVGRIYERDSVKQSNSDLLGYTPTIKCMPAPQFDNDTYRDFFYDVTATGTPSI